jgi:hypothetical protein
MSDRPRKVRATIVGVDEIHENTSTQIITITTDKLKIILIEHLHRVDKSKAWHAPLSLFLAIILVFCSANFKDALGISASAWCAIFVLSGLASFVWLVVTLFQVKSGITVEDVINIIKNKN